MRTFHHFHLTVNSVVKRIDFSCFLSSERAFSLIALHITSQVDLACTAGSPLGAKLASAFETCLGGEEALKPEQVELANYIQSLGLIKFKLSSPKRLSSIHTVVWPWPRYFAILTLSGWLLCG